MQFTQCELFSPHARQGQETQHGSEPLTNCCIVLTNRCLEADVRMSDLLVELEALATGIRTDSNHVDEDKMQGKVCLLSLKFDSNNIDVAKQLTTEGMSLPERVTFIQELSKTVDAEVFEFSTCNRVLFVGFDVDSTTLAVGISKMTNIDEIPFQTMTGSNAWRHLVKICSGLDSFIIGELQVMSQLRSSITLHKENNLIGTFNLAFFEHIISATRIIRKELGYTSSTESMLNLATNSLEDILTEKGDVQSVVLGFGDMGIKAVETLQALGQNNIVVISRNPSESAERNPSMAERCTMISYSELNKKRVKADIVISTMRCSTPAYTEKNPLPISGQATILDFSWPPSIAEDGVSTEHTLLGMKHWIQVARNIDNSEYTTLMQKGNKLIANIQDRYMEALTNKNEARFRAFIYGHMENLSASWEESSSAQEKEIPQLGAFAREIATWICQQNSSFYLSELTNYVNSTNRSLNSNLLAEVSQDVETSIRTLATVA